MKKSKKESAIVLIPLGVVLWIAARTVAGVGEHLFLISWLIGLSGTVAFLVGLARWAQAKGHSGVYCLFGLIPIIGLVIVALLRDKLKTDVPEIDQNDRTIDCPKCGTSARLSDYRSDVSEIHCSGCGEVIFTRGAA